MATQKKQGISPEIKFEQFINAVGTGSFRSRNILNLLMTAAFVSALALYNSMPAEYNWLTSRISALQNAYFWVRFPDDETAPKQLVLGKDTFPNSFTLEEYRNKFTHIPALVGGDIAALREIPMHLRIVIPNCYIRSDSTLDVGKIDQSSVSNALYTLASMHTTNRKELDNLLRSYDRARLENALLIRIPILGITFDVNGLAIISAIAFSILFYLLYHSLSRERKNLTLIFRLAEEQFVDKTALYQLLSMQQVLTVPSSIDEYIQSAKAKIIIERSHWEKFKNMSLRLFTLMPIVGPLIIWWLIYQNDNMTVSIGRSINDSMTTWTSGWSQFLGVLAFINFAICIYEWVKIDQLWRKEAKAIRKQLMGHLLIPPKSDDEPDTSGSSDSKP